MFYMKWSILPQFTAPYHLIVCAILLAVTVGSLILINVFFEHNVIKQLRGVSEALDRGLEEDAVYLLETARELDAAQTFDRYIESRDIANLLSAVVAERDRRNLDGLLITDDDGIVLTRSKAVQQRGDFIYHTTVWGRALAEGNEVLSAEKGVAHPLDVLGAVPMERSGAHFGSIVAAYIIDDSYTKRLKNKYLPRGTEIAFSMDEEGIIGHSFENANYGRILSFYFNEGSDVLRSTSTIYRVTFNGDDYYVRNSFVYGSEGVVANALVFVPAHGKVKAAAYAVAVAIGFIVLFFALVPYLRFGRPVLFLFCLIGTTTVFAVTYYISLEYSKANTLRLSQPTFAIYNSTMELDPPVAALNRQFEHRVGIRIISGGEAINAVEARLRFDPTVVRIVDIDFSRSLCNNNLIIERKIDNDAGNVAIVCGLPNPGFLERTGIVADLVLQPLSAGRLALAFEEETKVLANDGLGTQVLRYATNGSYIVVNEIIQSDGTGTNFLIFSPTHTNSERWYSSRTIMFTWTNQPGDHFRYTLTDSSADPSFVGADQVVSNNLAIDVPSDGMFYFHLEQENEDERRVTFHKVQIDRSPPEPPQIRVSNEEPRTGELVRFEFTSVDKLSGLQKNFYIKLDDGIFLPVGGTFTTAFLDPGEHTVTVRAFDKANNFSESTVTIRVRSPLGAMLFSALGLQ